MEFAQSVKIKLLFSDSLGVASLLMFQRTIRNVNGLRFCMITEYSGVCANVNAYIPLI